MATIYDKIIVAHDETSTNAQHDLIAETGYVMLAGLKIKRYFKNIVSGMRPATVYSKVNCAKASGTITLAAFVATDVITINGVAFTCKSSGASGATEFNVGGDDTASAVSAIAAFNAHTTLDGMVIATSATSVITITALEAGELGNAVTIAISAHGTASGARLTGGTNGDVERTHYYGSSSLT